MRLTRLDRFRAAAQNSQSVSFYKSYLCLSLSLSLLTVWQLEKISNLNFEFFFFKIKKTNFLISNFSFLSFLSVPFTPQKIYLYVTKTGFLL